MLPLTNALFEVAVELTGLTKDEVRRRLDNGEGVEFRIPDRDIVGIIGEIEGVPYVDFTTADKLRQPTANERYKVMVDGVIVDSTERLFQAAWLAEKLCHTMIPAYEIMVSDGTTVYVRWKNNSRHQFGSWVNTATK